MSHGDRVADLLSEDPPKGATSAIPGPEGTPTEGVPDAPKTPAWQRRVMKLFAPYSKGPRSFDKDGTAETVNEWIDRRFNAKDGDAKKARVGQSVALCLEVLGVSGGGGVLPPIGHLMTSIGKFLVKQRLAAQGKAAKRDGYEVAP